MALGSLKSEFDFPLEKIRFDPIDLVFLMGGIDQARFIVDYALISNLDLLAEKESIAKKEFIDRYQIYGIVDKAGRLSEELETALYPLSKPGISITDNQEPNALLQEADKRKTAVYAYKEFATGVKRAPGMNGGFYLIPFGEKSEWNAETRSCFGLDTFQASSYKGSAITTNSHLLDEFVSSLLEADVNSMSTLAEMLNLSKEGLVDMANLYKSDDLSYGKDFMSFVTTQITGELETKYGFNMSYPKNGTVRFMTTSLYPQKGFAFQEIVSPQKGAPDNYWEDENLKQESSFGKIKFLNDQKVDMFEFLSTIETYPDN